MRFQVKCNLYFYCNKLAQLRVKARLQVLKTEVFRESFCGFGSLFDTVLRDGFFQRFTLLLVLSYKLFPIEDGFLNTLMVIESGWNLFRELKRQIAKSSTSLLRCIDPELSHKLGGILLQHPLVLAPLLPRLKDWQAVGVGGTSFCFSGRSVGSPIGLAAGFDKNATMMQGLECLGFGALELGTVTPLPQEGNPKPRLFRIKEQHALINRLGFNSDGLDNFYTKLDKWFPARKVPVGVNVGKNKLTPPEHALADFVVGLKRLEKLCDYAVVNVSSPNTPGLRLLGTPDFLERLRKEIADSIAAKTWIKLDSDRTQAEINEMGQAVLDCGFSGVILSNTRSVSVPEQGGLSGRPIFNQAYKAVSLLKDCHGEKLNVIACGGISNGIEALRMLQTGACFLQLYTSLVYRGPWVVWEILNEMRQGG